MSRRNIKILTDVDGKQDLSVSGTLTVKADSSFVIPSISTSSDGFYSINNAIHKIDKSLQDVNARVVSSVGNVLGQYNASRYVFNGFLNASGAVSINITRNSPSGTVYFKESDISNLSVNILTDFDGDGIFTNNLVPYQIRPSNGDLLLNISAPSAPNVMYKATVINDSAIIDIPSQNDVYLVTDSGSSTVDGQTVLLDNISLYNKNVRNFYVSPSGSDDNDGLTLSSSFATIQKAVDSISTYTNSATTRLQYHTAINLASGSYTEKVNILNKDLSGKNSNLLLAFKGEKQNLYENLRVISHILIDKDSGGSAGFSQIVLNFTSPPADNSLKGLYINKKTSPLSSGILITGNSGSTIYTTVGSSTWSAIQSATDFYIFRNLSTVNGFFRIAGSDGVISFRNVNLNVSLNEANGSDTFFFSSVMNPIGTIDIDNTGEVAGTAVQTRYGSYSNDEIQVINCNIFNDKTSGLPIRLVAGPKTYMFSCFITSSTSHISITNLNQVDSFNALSCNFENAGISLTSVPLISTSNSSFLNSTLSFTSCDSVTLPQKAISTRNTGDRIGIYNSYATSPSNAYYKNVGFDVVNKSMFILASPFSAHGPFNSRFLNITNNSFIEFGSVNSTSSFSGALNTDYLVQATGKSNINVNSRLDVQNVYSPSVNPFFAFFGASTMSFLYYKPLTAASGTANYRSNGDIKADDYNYFYTDLPVITTEAVKIDDRTNVSATKYDFRYPLQTTRDITLTGSAQLISSLVKLNPYTTLPAGSLGLMAVSGSSLYFHNGTSWNKVI